MGWDNMRFLAMSSIIALMIISVIIPSSTMGAVSPVPGCTLAISPTTQKVTVTPSAQGSVEFTGTLKIDKWPVERVIVSLEATTDQGWVAIVNPSSLVVTTGVEQTVGLTVTVPQATPATSIGKATVSVRCTGGGLSPSPTISAVSITVSQYFRMNIESDAPYKEISPASQVFYVFKIWNRGNGLDSFSLDVANLKELSNKGWVVSLSSTTVENVLPEEYANVRITAQSPRQWNVWKSQAQLITIRVSSLNAKIEGLPSPPTQDYSMYAYERGMSAPGPDPGIIIIVMGAMAVFILRKDGSHEFY